MKIINKKEAFTLLELIMVIVILGIVASIGSSVIVQVYESYIMQRAIHNASLKTELAINQLSNRLTYRINRSLLARVPGTQGIARVNALPLSEVADGNDTYSALEWIGYDNDGFSAFATNAAGATPAWSGFCDLNASDFIDITTRGSRLSVSTNTRPSAQRILNSLSRLDPAPAPAIIFVGAETYRNPPGGISREYNTTCMHQTNGAGCMFPVTFPNDNTLRFRAAVRTGDRVNNQMVYSEFYQLAASAYAVVPMNPHKIGDVDVWDLHLYADYQPWNGDDYADGSDSLLAKNVSVFRFRQESGSLRIKICTVEQIGDKQTISICKEKAVIR